MADPKHCLLRVQGEGEVNAKRNAADEDSADRMQSLPQAPAGSKRQQKGRKPFFSQYLRK
jgi:hypothetical protein